MLPETRSVARSQAGRQASWSIEWVKEDYESLQNVGGGQT